MRNKTIVIFLAVALLAFMMLACVDEDSISSTASEIEEAAKEVEENVKKLEFGDGMGIARKLERVYEDATK